uniref:F-box domain-containing protein n=1 Tax=Leersia perrieri TaxID=77586 RepID=A0A0D9VW49_9ORYZ
MMEEPAARTNELPEDVLAEILRRLPPRSLAVSRCVCAAWRSAIDTRRMLRTDLLPLSLAGIFIDFLDLRFPELFSRNSRSSPTPINGKLDFLPHDEGMYFIMDHCNGLLLLPGLMVANPATRRWARLPPLPSHFAGQKGVKGFYDQEVFLVFDPTISHHYQVFMIPSVNIGRYSTDRMNMASEWPSSRLLVRVFSSMTGEWEERPLVRQGDAAGTVTDVAERMSRLASACIDGNVFWRGALYINSHCVIRISMSDRKYQVIKHPMIYNSKQQPDIYIGKSEKGVYLASLLGTECCLSVWILHESGGHFEWILKHQNNLKPLLRCLNQRKQVHGPWISQDVNYHLYSQKFPGEWEIYDSNYDPSHFQSPNDIDKTPVENNFEWDSDDDSVVGTQGDIEEGNVGGHIQFLGFHPFKEVVFFSSLYGWKGLAYHLNSSKLQYLGNLQPKHYEYFSKHEDICRSSTYTPCWMEQFPGISYYSTR